MRKKQRFGIKVYHPRGFINYRALEVSVRGIEVEIKDAESVSRKMKLYKIRKNINQILNEL